MFKKKEEAELEADPPVNKLLVDDEEYYALRQKVAEWSDEELKKYEAHLRDLVIRRLATLDKKVLLAMVGRLGDWEFKIDLSTLAKEVLMKKL